MESPRAFLQLKCLEVGERTRMRKVGANRKMTKPVLRQRTGKKERNMCQLPGLLTEATVGISMGIDGYIAIASTTVQLIVLNNHVLNNRTSARPAGQSLTFLSQGWSKLA